MYISNVKIMISYKTVLNALDDEDPATGETEEVENNENFVGLDTNSVTNLTGNSTTNKRRRLDGDRELHMELSKALMQSINFAQPFCVNVELSKFATVPENATTLKNAVTHFTRFMQSELHAINDEDARNEVIHCLFKMLFYARRKFANKYKQ
ncbi:uncharacterized protein LOC120356895 [Solenopsis invicta]|uniref:uncharacterized protein LOC120356895 n=1 Tax=Solenopsis invicta TaxID=13686 RepID=UPI00193E3C5A|nr:uncharacterized protein LOC120356895 [Solenopsis invicta]